MLRKVLSPRSLLWLSLIVVLIVLAPIASTQTTLSRPPLPPDRVPPGYQFPVVKPTPQKTPTQRLGNAEVRSVSPGILSVNGHKCISDEIVVKFFEDTPDAMINNLIGRYGGKIVQWIYGPYQHWYLVRFPAGAKIWEIADAYNDDPSVECAGLSWIGEGGMIPNDYYYSQQWNLSKINAPAAWDLTQGSASTIIAVIDSGVDLSHLDLVNKILSCGSDICDFIDDDSTPNDQHGHGTLVSGIVAAETNNSIGVASLGWNPKILPVRLLDGNNFGISPDVVAGINYAVAKGAHVLNLSLHGFEYDPNTRNAITNAISNGRIVIGITGNNGAASYPGSYPNVIAVGASDENDNQASFSNSGSFIAVVAPGVNILSTYPGGYTAAEV